MFTGKSPNNYLLSLLVIKFDLVVVLVVSNIRTSTVDVEIIERYKGQI